MQPNPCRSNYKPRHLRQHGPRIDSLFRLREWRATRQMAEGVGFEPTDPCGSPVFKTGAIDRSTTPPVIFASRVPAPKASRTTDPDRRRTGLFSQSRRPPTGSHSPLSLTARRPTLLEFDSTASRFARRLLNPVNDPLRRLPRRIGWRIRRLRLATRFLADLVPVPD